MKFLRDWFTGGDGQTYDVGRFLWFQSIQAYIGLTVYQMYKIGAPVDFVTWGGGLAALLGAGGAALGLKANTEPKPSMSVTTMTDTPTGSTAMNVAVNQPASASAPPVIVTDHVIAPGVTVPMPVQNPAADNSSGAPKGRPKRLRKPKTTP